MRSKIIAGILLGTLFPVVVLGANAYSLKLERDYNQILTIPDSEQTNLDIIGDFTVEAWINPESLQENSPMDIVSKHNESDRGYTFGLAGIPGALVVLFVDAAGNASQFETAEGTIVSGIWQHVAVSVDASMPSARFYVNGIEVPVALVPYSAATSINNNAASFRIGTRETDTFYFDGLIDEVRVWNTIRSERQIQGDMVGKVRGNKNRIVGEWLFDSQTFIDTSDGNNHLSSVTAGPAVEFSTDIP